MMRSADRWNCHASSKVAVINVAVHQPVPYNQGSNPHLGPPDIHFPRRIHGVSRFDLASVSSVVSATPYTDISSFRVLVVDRQIGVVTGTIVPPEK
jgi:hypothetical protein